MREAPPATISRKAPERTTAELIAEAQKIIDRMEKEPEPVKVEPKPQPNINEIKKFSRILQDYRYIK